MTSRQALTDMLELLETISPGESVFIPEELLAVWFPPGVRGGDLANPSRKAASDFAHQTCCTFEFLPVRNAGRFTRIARC